MMCREKEYEPVHSDMMCDGCAFNKRTLSSKPCEHFSENICKSLVWREVGNRFMEILKEQRAALDRKKKACQEREGQGVLHGPGGEDIRQDKTRRDGGRCDVCVFGSGTITHCSCPKCFKYERLLDGRFIVKVGHYKEAKEDEK